MSDSCTLLGNRLSQWEKNLDEEEMNPLVSQFYFSCGFPIIKEELFLIEALFSYKVKAYSVCSAYFFIEFSLFHAFIELMGTQLIYPSCLKLDRNLKRGHGAYTYSSYLGHLQRCEAKHHM